MTTDNRKVWDSLKETDPRFTKRINKGFGEITTIDPQWQIMKITEQFGPLGIGWSYRVDYNYHGMDNNQTAVVSAEVSVAINKNPENFWDYYGPVCSVLKMYRKTGALDDEAPKKTMTDALTKAFSHLGLCSDIFMGKFDDSKYVKNLEEKYSSNKADQSKVTKTK